MFVILIALRKDIGYAYDYQQNNWIEVRNERRIRTFVWVRKYASHAFCLGCFDKVVRDNVVERQRRNL